MRVDYTNQKWEFFDSVAEPVMSEEWQRREVFGHVGADAVSISIWARYHPSGSAWVATPTFEVVESPWDPNDERSIRELIRKFADLRNAHAGAALAALYSDDGEWFGRMGNGLVHGRPALQTLWSGTVGRRREPSSP
jgi:hypothetical protein